MLADDLRARVERISELETRMDPVKGEPMSEDERRSAEREIARITLTRMEERHLACISQWRRLKRRIASTEAMPDPEADVAALQARLDALTSRPDFEERPRFKVKAQQLQRRIEAGGDYARPKSRLPMMRRKVEELEMHGDVITKSDFVMPDDMPVPQISDRQFAEAMTQENADG